MEWTEIIMKVPSAQLEQAADMAQMAVDGGIYVRIILIWRRKPGRLPILI